MKILVCISNVPDTTTKVTFTENNTKFNTQGVQFIINPYDELALTRALEITEKDGGTVTTITVGLADTEATIRKALAIGAHEAVRINAEPTDAYFVAEQIAAYAKNENFDLILTGRESIDYNGGLVCGLLAEMLGWPSVNVVTKLDIANGVATMVRDIDGGKETVSCKLPLVASAQKEFTEPRIPNMRGIMAARTKPLKVVEPTGSEKTSATIAFELPPAKGSCKMIPAEQAEQLIDLLHNEAKII
jgi:electron transfer flavoprotein beta subunit